MGIYRNLGIVATLGLAALAPVGCRSARPEYREVPDMSIPSGRYVVDGMAGEAITPDQDGPGEYSVTLTGWFVPRNFVTKVKADDGTSKEERKLVFSQDINGRAMAVRFEHLTLDEYKFLLQAAANRNWDLYINDPAAAATGLRRSVIALYGTPGVIDLPQPHIEDNGNTVVYPDGMGSYLRFIRETRLDQRDPTEPPESFMDREGFKPFEFLDEIDPARTFEQLKPAAPVPAGAGTQ